MAIDNKDKKVLKSSIEREQNEVACSAECEKIKGSKNLNVPHLRFPEFSGEWKKHSLGEIGETIIGLTYKPSDVVDNNGIIVFRSSNIKNGMIDYSDLVRVNKHIKDKIITKENDILVCARNGSQRLIGKNAIIKQEDANNTFGAFMMVYRANDNPFILPLLSTKKYFSQVGENLGARINQITTSDFNGFEFYFPENHAERTKIAELFRLLDERIATQNKIIEKLQSLIKGIAQHCIKESTSGNTYVKLGDICQITTGKLDANAQVDNGIYPFFTCAEQPFKIDSFAFDTEALLISGNGANLGYINYYKGKFNAYQRTYVLDLFSENIQYIKWALKVLLPKRIAIEKSSSNTPYIVLSTLTDLRLPIPCKSKQSFIANLMQSLERKLSNQIAQYDSYNYLKQYLLRQMFI